MVTRHRLQLNIAWKVDRRALLSPRLFEPPTPPLDIAWPDPVLVLQNAPDPNVSRHLILGDADRLAVKIFRPPNPAIGADIDCGMTKQPGHEGRNRNIVGIAPRGAEHVRTHRNFADVELLKLERAMKRFLGFERDSRYLAALDRRASIENSARAIVIANRQA